MGARSVMARNFSPAWCLGMKSARAPACRWAQPAIEAVRALQRAHGFSADDIAQIAIETFREAVALGSARTVPLTTDDAQYSLPYPVAAALVFGRVGASETDERALSDA